MIDELSCVDDIFKAVTCEYIAFTDWHTLTISIEKSFDSETCHHKLEIMLVLENIFWLRIIRTEH
jgi:hypothetical protein